MTNIAELWAGGFVEGATAAQQLSEIIKRSQVESSKVHSTNFYEYIVFLLLSPTSTLVQFLQFTHVEPLTMVRYLT